MQENKLRLLNGGGEKLELIAKELSRIYQEKGYDADLSISDYQNEKNIKIIIKTRYLYYALAGQLIRAQVTLTRKQNDILYDVGHGQWLDKALVSISIFLYIKLAILLPVVIVGLVRQVNFFNDIKTDIIKLHSNLI